MSVWRSHIWLDSNPQTKLLKLYSCPKHGIQSQSYGGNRHPQCEYIEEFGGEQCLLPMSEARFRRESS